MKIKLQGALKDLTDHDEKLMDFHGVGILDGHTHEFLRCCGGSAIYKLEKREGHHVLIQEIFRATTKRISYSLASKFFQMFLWVPRIPLTTTAFISGFLMPGSTDHGAFGSNHSFSGL